MSGHWGILVSDPWLQNQFTQVELRSLKSQVSSSWLIWSARMELFEYSMFFPWKIGIWCCYCNWGGGLRLLFFNGWCSLWAWGGRVEGLRLETWLPRWQGWRLWERIWVKKREALIFRICIRTQVKRSILNCFSRWAL